MFFALDPRISSNILWTIEADMNAYLTFDRQRETNQEQKPLAVRLIPRSKRIEGSVRDREGREDSTKKGGVDRGWWIDKLSMM